MRNAASQTFVARVSGTCCRSFDGAAHFVGSFAQDDTYIKSHTLRMRPLTEEAKF
jgi:hypothetical protein